MDFQYVAKDKAGAVVRGQVSADTRSEALRVLVQKSLVPTKVHEVRVAARAQRIKSRDPVSYTHLTLPTNREV